MGVIWRERIVAARTRPGFTQEDRRDMQEGETCMVGEAATAAGLDAHPGMAYMLLSGHLFLHGGRRLEDAAIRAVWIDAVDAAERCLDAIEDRARQFKRQLAG